jgi:hypothetical protein
MSEYVGLALLDLTYAGVGTSALIGLGLVRSARSFALYLGLAVLVGWALVGTAASMLLIMGLAATVVEVLAAALLIAGACLVLGKRVPAATTRFAPNPGGVATWVAVGGVGVLLVLLEALGRRALYSEPIDWDVWSFWLPKAESIVYFHGLDTGVGGFTSFANPDYPPFAPAVDSLAYRFAGQVDNGIIPLQHWVLAVAFFGALAVLLARRVPPWILWPSLALLAVMPSYVHLVGSALADEPLSACVALAIVCAALWLLDDDPRLIVLTIVFCVAATLLKNEGLSFTLLIAVLLALTARGRRVRAPLAIALAAIVAIVPWKLWLNAHDVPRTPAYDTHDLVRPSYLADRIGRLGISLHEVPPYFFSWSAWLVAVPLAIALAAVLVRSRRPVGAFALAAIGVAVVGNIIVYWVSTFPIHWYIRTSADRTSSTVAVFCAALTPLLAAEAFRARRERVD